MGTWKLTLCDTPLSTGPHFLYFPNISISLWTKRSDIWAYILIQTATLGLFNLSNWLIFEDNCHFYITFCCISSPTSHRQIYVCLMYGGRLYCKLYLSNFRKWITHLEPRVKGSKSIPFTFIRVLKVQGFIVLFDNTCFKNM